LEPATIKDLGVVFTGVAVKKGIPLPAIHDAAAFKGTLLDARGIYFPDPQSATAGIHFMRVIDQLGIRIEVASRLRPFPNGATAMREMAKASGEKLIGITACRLLARLPRVRWS
jgi:molybdate transport system substrate-binding protein